MPVYNGEKFISAAIESILNQTHSDLEFIIIDDGSKDNTYEIMKQYAGKDERIRIFKNKNNLGLTESLNKAIMLSNGEFIARQDVDDFSMNNRLEVQSKFLLKNSDYAFCGSNVVVKQNVKRMFKILDYNSIKSTLIKRNCFWHSTIMIRKKILKKFGLYDKKLLYSQDYELWCRLIYKYKLKAINLPDQLVLMHVPMKKLTNKDRRKFSVQLKNSILVKLKYINYTEYKIKGIISILSNSLTYLFSLNQFTFNFISNFFLKIKRTLVDFQIN